MSEPSRQEKIEQAVRDSFDEQYLDTTPKHGARLLCGGGRSWAQCLCGWESPGFRTSAAASLAWAKHVATP
jgi:hypothetical protein